MRASRIRKLSDQTTASLRSAFTLVELLIVIGLLLTLITITIVAVDFTFESERVAASSRQVQSMLEGARNRAIYAREARGVRFLVAEDQFTGRTVNTMVFVGASEPWREGMIWLERADFEEDGNNNYRLDPGEDANGNGRLDGDGVADGTNILVVRGDDDNPVLWNSLKQRGFLGVYEDSNFNGVLDAGEDDPLNGGNGNGVLDLDAPRIKIPGDRNGTWYTVLTWLLKPNDERLLLHPLRPYRNAGTTPPDEVLGFGRPMTYILELPPRILPDAEPVQLTDGVIIDLDASAVPPFWRPSHTANLNTLADRYVFPYSNKMDVMFGPRGTVTGPAAAAGLINLQIGLREDLQKFIEVQRPPVDRFGPNTQPLVPVDSLLPSGKTIGDRAIVTVYPQTGKVARSDFDPTDDRAPNGYADQPFFFAERGEVKSK